MQGPALRQAIREVLKRCLDIDRFDVFLFGSEATGEGSVRSDIDIGILGKEPLQASTLRSIREQLEALRTLRTFDVVDFATADESFKSVALQHVERF